MDFRSISHNEIEKLSEIDRRELVEQNYRLKDGGLELFPFHCDIQGFGDDQLLHLKHDLYTLHDRGGFILGAFDGPRLIGIASLGNIWRGPNRDRLQLALLHVSCEYRKNGIGKHLVEMIKEHARIIGAGSLYVSASPIRNTIDFYQAVGCRVTSEIEEDLFELEPEDIHMVLEL